MATEILESKVRCLEQTVQELRDEVDIKMKIMGQILNTRNEQFLVHKKLIEEEQVLFQSVLSNWMNSVPANGQKQDQLWAQSLPANVDIQGIKRDSATSLERMTLRAKRFRLEASTGSLDMKVIENMRDVVESHSSTFPPVDTACDASDSDAEQNSDVDGDSDEGEQEDGGLAVSGMEKRVFINYYSENATCPEEGSCDPVWLHFMREEKGTAALCKYCDEKGFQQIYKMKTSGLGLLRRHLKRKHKIIVEIFYQPSAIDALDTSEDKNNTFPRKTIFLRHNDNIYTRYGKKNGIEFWRCRDRTCPGRIVNRYGAIRLTREHSCLMNAADCDAVLLREKVRELAQCHPHLSPAAIITAAKEGFSDEVLDLVPTESLRRTIRRIRHTLQSAAEQPSTEEWT